MVSGGLDPEYDCGDIILPAPFIGQIDKPLAGLVRPLIMNQLKNFFRSCFVC
jgi:hypothetical protein